MKLTRLLIGICAISVCSCGPKISTSIAKSAPVRESGSPVAIYRNDGQLPQGAESLGKVKISDSGFSTRCDSATVFSAAITEAEKAGGDALLITKSKKPSIWSSCHQIEAVIFKLPDHFFESQLQSQPNVHYSSGLSKPERIAPRITFAANAGYSWRTAKLNPNLPRDTRRFYENLTSGFTWDISGAYFFNDTYGISMSYLNYRASHSEFGTLSDNNFYETGTLKMTDNIYYIGPAFVIRYPTKNQKWLFDLSVGLGYIHYNHEETFNRLLFKSYGGTIGFQTAIGAEYRLSQVIGIGANFKTTSGLLTSWTNEENGQKENVSVSGKKGEEGEGLGQINLMIGVRFYIK